VTTEVTLVCGAAPRAPKQPFDLAFDYLPSLTTLPPKFLGEKFFQVTLRARVLLGSSRKLALCGGSVHAASLATPRHRLPFGLEFLENSRLRKAVSDLTLDKLILQDAARGNF
jgi:hypothetical protein